jgi:hypothetical protein
MYKIYIHEKPLILLSKGEHPQNNFKTIVYDNKTDTLLAIVGAFENNNSGSINYEFIGDYQNLEESIETQTSRAINNLIQNWETYKVNYDNLHGEDAYNKIYGTYFDEYTNLEYISDSEDEY